MDRLIIERLGHRGDGIAPGPIFVPGVLPGEEVEGVIEAGAMAAPKIVTPSPDRVRAPCRHAKVLRRLSAAACKRPVCGALERGGRSHGT